MAILKSLAGLLYSNDKVVSVVGETAVNGGIESGSNVNGKYTKFPDGTLVCWYNDPTEYTTAVGFSPFFNYYKTSYTFPHTFIEAPSITFECYRVDTFGVFSAVGGGGTITTTNSGDIRLLGISDTASGKIGYIATGRWK